MSPKGETKRIRVYDDNGDFFIDVPVEAELTMQYFNPSRDEDGAYGRNGRQMHHSSRRTRLSVKVGGKQVAVFLGVGGFRDESKVTLTRLRQKVVIEKKLADDGEGSVTWGGSEVRELIAAPEEGTYQ